ncbi:hypothetical protein ACJRPK_07475 [Aquimarina sp. 2-A2]|uniref:hypothetical protein n=1 Tax=Aquimarina TaxID=290174 RepID=UPI0011E6776B|nr:hypothetical protein [Aquimarina intermedia]
MIPTSKEPSNQLRNQKSRYLLTGSIAVILISFTPYIFYLYQSLPDGDVWETFLFTYKSPYYQNVGVFGWMIMGKFIPIILLLIWFFTCRHWWYLVILIPLSMYILQLISVIRDDISNVDEVEIFYIAPFIIIILALLYAIRVKVFDKIHNIDISEMDSLLPRDRKRWWNKFR